MPSSKLFLVTIDHLREVDQPVILLMVVLCHPMHFIQEVIRLVDLALKQLTPVHLEVSFDQVNVFEI
jgi:hypothetical protein